MKNGLIAHNALRSIHGSKPMKATPNLIRKAREWAKSISDAGKSVPAKKQEIIDVGENVDINCNVDGKQMNSEDAVLRWYGDEFNSFKAYLPCYTLPKHQKSSDFLTFLGGIKREY